MYRAKAYSAASATSSLASTAIPRREPTSRDVQIEICFAASATLTYIRSETNGAARYRPRIPASPVMKLSVV